MVTSYIGGSCTTTTAPIIFSGNKTYVTPYQITSDGVITSVCFRVRWTGNPSDPKGHVSLIILRQNGNNWDYVGESPAVEVTHSFGETVTTDCSIIVKNGDRIGWYSDNYCGMDVLSATGPYTYHESNGKQTGTNFNLPNTLSDYGDVGVVATFNDVVDYTHIIDYDWSFLPSEFLNLVTSNIIDISNVLGTDLPMPSNIVYKGATFSGGKFRIYVQYTPPMASPVKLSAAQLANMTPQALTELLQAGVILDFEPTGLQTMLSLPPMNIILFAGSFATVIIFIAEALIITKSAVLVASPWVWGAAAAIALIGGVSGVVLGYNIIEMFSGTTTGTGTVQDPPAKKTEDAITTMTNDLAKCLADHPCKTSGNCSVAETKLYDTCAQAAALINKINTDAIAGTPPSITQADVQVILDAYSALQTGLTNGTISVADAMAQIDAMTAKAKAEAAAKLAAETCPSGQTYDPTTQKCVQAAGDCWIAGLTPGSCMLTAKTGKTIAIIGGVVIGGYLVFSLIKK